MTPAAGPSQGVTEKGDRYGGFFTVRGSEGCYRLW
jgi:hypothetical protein